MGGMIGDIDCPNTFSYRTLEKRPLNALQKSVRDMSDFTLGYMVAGKSMFNRGELALGENYFIDSTIECDKQKSDAKCENKTQHTYIRNIPTGTIPGLNTSFKQLTGAELPGLTESRGIVPGLLEDAADINPYTLGHGIFGGGNYGSPICKSVKLPVGKKIYDPTEVNRSWHWEERCSASYLNTVPTTDATLNRSVRAKNTALRNGKGEWNMGIPASLGVAFPEDFTTQRRTYRKIWALRFVVVLVGVLLFFVVVFTFIRRHHSRTPLGGVGRFDSEL